MAPRAFKPTLLSNRGAAVPRPVLGHQRRRGTCRRRLPLHPPASYPSHCHPYDPRMPARPPRLASALPSAGPAAAFPDTGQAAPLARQQPQRGGGLRAPAPVAAARAPRGRDPVRVSGPGMAARRRTAATSFWAWRETDAIGPAGGSGRRAPQGRQQRQRMRESSSNLRNGGADSPRRPPRLRVERRARGGKPGMRGVRAATGAGVVREG